MPISLKSVSGGGNVPVGGIAKFSADLPPLIERDGATYLKNGYYADSDYSDEFDPEDFTGNFWETLMPVGDFPSNIAGGGHIVRNLSIFDVNPDGIDDVIIIVLATNTASVARTYRSVDNGETFTELTTPVDFFTVFYTNGVWIANGDNTSGKLYRSTDNGDTWTAVYTATDITIGDMASNDNGIIIGSDGDTSTRRLIRSTDNGATWTVIAGGLGNAPNLSSISTNKSGLWVVQCRQDAINQDLLLFSTNEGASWTAYRFNLLAGSTRPFITHIGGNSFATTYGIVTFNDLGNVDVRGGYSFGKYNFDQPLLAFKYKNRGFVIGRESFGSSAAATQFSKWLVIKTDNAGATWQTVPTFSATSIGGSSNRASIKVGKNYMYQLKLLSLFSGPSQIRVVLDRTVPNAIGISNDEDAADEYMRIK